VPLSRAERQGLKAARRAGLAGGALLDDFADDVADLVQVGPPGPDIRVVRAIWLERRGWLCGCCTRTCRLWRGHAEHIVALVLGSAAAVLPCGSASPALLLSRLCPCARREDGGTVASA